MIGKQAIVSESAYSRQQVNQPIGKEYGRPHATYEVANDATNRNLSPLVGHRATQEKYNYDTTEGNSYVSRSPLNTSSTNYQAFNSR